MIFRQDVLGKEGRGILSKSVEKFVKVGQFLRKILTFLPFF